MKTQHIDLRSFVNSPQTMVLIKWTVDGSSGSTLCEAWRGQHEINCLERAGYIITSIGKG